MGVVNKAGIVTLLGRVVMTVALFLSEDPPSFEDRLRQARELLKQSPLIDGHNDLATNIRQMVYNRLNNFPFESDLTSIEPWASNNESHTDLPRLRQGALGAQFWSTWVPCPSQYKNAFTLGMEQIDVIKRLTSMYPNDLHLATNSSDIMDAFKEGKIASLIGVEGGHIMDSSLGVLRVLYDTGARYMTLTHLCNTPWADNSKAEEEMEFDGLTEWGELVVKEMNRLGMIIDVSHVAEKTMNDVMDVTAAPVIFSHSNARALCDHHRNVPDEVLDRLKENGGIIMANFYSEHLTCSKMSTLHDVIEHINYIRDRIGIDHVGIGSDFDGIDLVPEGLEDVSTFPALFAELMLDPAWSEEDLKKLAGLNLIRVFKAVEQVRDDSLSDLPIDDIIPAEDIKEHKSCSHPWPEGKENDSPVVFTGTR